MMGHRRNEQYPMTVNSKNSVVHDITSGSIQQLKEFVLSSTMLMHGRTRAELLRTCMDVQKLRIKEQNLEGISWNDGLPLNCSFSGKCSQNFRGGSEQPCLYCYLDFSELSGQKRVIGPNLMLTFCQLVCLLVL